MHTHHYTTYYIACIQCTYVHIDIIELFNDMIKPVNDCYGPKVCCIDKPVQGLRLTKIYHCFETAVCGSFC